MSKRASKNTRHSATQVYLHDSLDVVHDHGGFHRHTRHTHGKASLPLKVIYLLKLNQMRTTSMSFLLKELNEHSLVNSTYTFEAS